MSDSVTKNNTSASVVQGVVMPRSDIKSELIRVAAVLVQGHYIPSDLVDDYPQKTYTAARVAQMMEKAHDKSRDLAVQVRRLSDAIKAEPIGPSSTDYDLWMAQNPFIATAISEKVKSYAYEIWRQAWMACEREHGIRKA
jgi:hypothetical protein